MPLEKIFKISLNHKQNRNRGAPKSTLQSASLTLEAALVFPVFLFGILGILFFFRAIQVQQMTREALSAAGAKAALEMWEEDKAWVKIMFDFQKELMEEGCPFDFIAGGRMGFHWEASELSEEYVDLYLSYDCRLPLRVWSKRNISIVQRVRIKKWNGFSEKDGSGQNGKWVYITPNGSVYHISGECTHLKLSVRITGAKELDRSRYDACLICTKKDMGHAYYYVTEEGMRYHTRLDCSGLKRTVYLIELSQVGNRNRCLRCGG